MVEDNNHSPGLATLASRFARTGLGAVQNRLELFAVEFKEERARLTSLMFASVAFACLCVLAVLLLSATVVFLVSEQNRVYVVAVFAIVYLLGAVVAWFGVRAMLKREPFAETIDQVKKDQTWLESLK
jgi:uncharacterized membrane protein YqjE